MKKVIFASLAALAALSAAPAFAAPGDFDRGRDNGFRDGRGDNVRDELFRLEERIDRNVRNGSLSWREARMLKDDVREVRSMQARFWRTGGLDRRERAILDRRIDNLRNAVWRESNDRGGRYGGGWR
jgi:hypothetical protein